MIDIVQLRSAALQYRHHLLWLLSALLLFSAVHIARVTMTPSAPLRSLPPSPKVEHIAIHQSALPETLFNEKNSWSPFAVSEMGLDDPRLRSAPISRLPFKVNGILYHASQRNSLAILSSGAQQFTVGNGETLEGANVLVAYIFPDRVIIINRGYYEALIWEPDTRG